MRVKDAFVRAVRTAAQAFVAASAIGVVSAFRDLADVKKAGVSLLLAAAFGVASGVVSFAQNIAEDNTAVPTVK
jgi:hypothetical protein